MKTVVIDACALIAYIRRESGAVVVERVLKDPGVKSVMHAINFYEVYYDHLRHQSGMTFMLHDLIDEAGISLVSRIDKATMEEGVAFKLHYKMSLADSIALGLTAKLGATLLTADRHELSEVARAKIVSIKFIR